MAIPRFYYEPAKTGSVCMGPFRVHDAKLSANIPILVVDDPVFAQWLVDMLVKADEENQLPNGWARL